MIRAAIKRYYNDAKAIPPAATVSNGDFTASLLYRFNIDESEVVVIYKIMSLSDIPANNGEPFRFRIGSIKSAQLFQISAENFFRLRYESVPLQ